MRRTRYTRLGYGLAALLALVWVYPLAAAGDDWLDSDVPIWEWSRMTGDWDGHRTALEEEGITIEGSWVLDGSYVFDGGVKERGAERWLLDVNATFDMNTMLGWTGATFFIDGQFQSGRDGSQDSGDAQVYSNIDADDFETLYEIWIEQMLLEDRLRIKIGKVDANGEFAFVDNGGEFLNSSMGFSPTILAFPTYPDPAYSVNVFMYPTDSLYAGVGVYDGATQAGQPTGPRGPRTALGDPTDLFYIAEVGGTWTLHHRDSDLPGRLGVGGWRHSGTFEEFDGTMADNADGFYLVLDQGVWRENPGSDDGQGVDAFFQFGASDDEVAELYRHIGVGAIWTGAVPTRDEDVAGVGLTWVELSDEPGAGFTEDDELTVELFYRVQVTPWFGVKPDLQIIRHPGGDRTLDTAVVGTLRGEIVF